MTKPEAEWTKPHFDDSAWKEGKSGFGTRDTPGAVGSALPGTQATFGFAARSQLPNRKYENLHLSIHHDEDADVYINGVLAVRAPGYVTGYDMVSMTPAAHRRSQAGPKNVLSVHCNQTGGSRISTWDLSMRSNSGESLPLRRGAG